MKHLSSLLTLATLAALLTGCATQNKPLTVAIVRQAVALGALYGAEQDPSVVPYLKVAAPVICNAASNSQVDPVDIVADLQATDVELLKTPQGVAIINGALAIYEAIYSSYGTNVQASVVQPYLQGVCEGLQQAFPPAAGVTARKLPPHIYVR